MNVLEAALEVFFGLLALLVRGAELSHQSGVFGEAGNVLVEHALIADEKHVPPIGVSPEPVKVSPQQSELAGEIVGAYAERFALRGFVPFVGFVVPASIFPIASSPIMLSPMWLMTPVKSFISAIEPELRPASCILAY